jgi:hypothetical protein
MLTLHVECRERRYPPIPANPCLYPSPFTPKCCQNANAGIKSSQTHAPLSQANRGCETLRVLSVMPPDAVMMPTWATARARQLCPDADRPLDGSAMPDVARAAPSPRYPLVVIVRKSCLGVVPSVAGSCPRNPSQKPPPDPAIHLTQPASADISPISSAPRTVWSER